MPRAKNQVRGERCHNAKLTADDIKLLFKCVAERERLRKQANELSNDALARKFEVHRATIEKVLRRETWYHVAS